jgi:hypothetical protein
MTKVGVKHQSINQSINQLQQVGNKESDRKMFLSQLVTKDFD